MTPVEHSLGPPGASVILIEYADFQCPYCRDAEGPLRQIRDVYENDLLFIFRQFPLTEVHEWAELAALASEAAALQGRFWEMHDTLFEIQDSLGPDSIGELAIELGLDVDRFWKDVKGEECRARVARDIRSAEELGLEGTPSILINDQLYLGTIDFASLSRAIAGRVAERAA